MGVPQQSWGFGWQQQPQADYTGGDGWQADAALPEGHSGIRESRSQRRRRQRHALDARHTAERAAEAATSTDELL